MRGHGDYGKARASELLKAGGEGQQPAKGSKYEFIRRYGSTIGRGQRATLPLLSTIYKNNDNRQSHTSGTNLSPAPTTDDTECRTAWATWPRTSGVRTDDTDCSATWPISECHGSSIRQVRKSRSIENAVMILKPKPKEGPEAGT